MALVRISYGFGGGTVDAPVTGDAFEFSLSAVFEEEPGASNQILDRLRDEYLVRSGGGGDSGADRHGQACHLAVVEFALAGVDARAQFESEIANALDECLGTANGPCRAVEGREEAVAGGVALLATEAGQLTANQSVMTF